MIQQRDATDKDKSLSSSFDVRGCDQVAQVVKLTFQGNYNLVTWKGSNPL